MATLIAVDGTELEVKPAGKKFTLTEMYALLGTDIVEYVALQKPRGAMWVDEEGKLKSKPFNPRATDVARTRRAGLSPWDEIVGPALVTKPGEA